MREDPFSATQEEKDAVQAAEFAQMLEDFANNPTDKGWVPVRPETLRDAAKRLRGMEQDAKKKVVEEVLGHMWSVGQVECMYDDTLYRLDVGIRAMLEPAATQCART